MKKLLEIASGHQIDVNQPFYSLTSHHGAYFIYGCGKNIPLNSLDDLPAVLDMVDPERTKCSLDLAKL
ncbi:MAG: hypothetical protein GY861_21630 [bacterium]|nr:hypothetical protein [bacterium]